ncbi:MAG: ABC transporter ATP-binding protein [Lachnospiraceae bacterium]|nr:ABC transporter ATP-binding protein [Lachnospiraceae bacterium]
MLEVTNLKKNYDGFSLACTLKVESGCITGLVGRNGSGKSTTFKSVLGLISKDSGEIKIFGKDIVNLTAEDKQKIGVILSNSGFSGYLNIRSISNILEAEYEAFDKKEFLNLCKHFELPIKKQIKEFSTGMKAKLNVLIALSHKAELLILDEPTSGLDVIAREEVLDMLRDYMEKNEKCSILISSHIASDLEKLCDQIYMIHNGNIILQEDTDVLLDSYALLKITKEVYEKMDKQYLLKVKKESWGYSCLTNQKQFYLDNYPDIAIEKGGIDDLISMMNGGESA